MCLGWARWPSPAGAPASGSRLAPVTCLLATQLPSRLVPFVPLPPRLRQILEVDRLDHVTPDIFERLIGVRYPVYAEADIIVECGDERQYFYRIGD